MSSTEEQQEVDEGDVMLYSDLDDVSSFKRPNEKRESLAPLTCGESRNDGQSFLSPESIQAEEKQSQVKQEKLISQLEELR